MKQKLVKYICLGAIIAGLTSFAGCEYDTIVPGDYEEGLLYLPAANGGGLYTIDNLTSIPLTPNPTPGHTYRYIADLEANTFTVPLSVYRGGLDRSKAVSVNLHVVNDSIASQIAKGMLADTVEILPADKYELVDQVSMATDAYITPFSLVVDFDFLAAASPKIYALAVGISSAEQACNPALSTVTVVINTAMMKAAPDFIAEADQANNLKIAFSNQSEYVLSGYAWDFGDGQTSTETNPVHTYPASGEYTVTLTAAGLNEASVICTKTITINE